VLRCLHELKLLNEIEQIIEKQRIKTRAIDTLTWLQPTDDISDEFWRNLIDLSVCEELEEASEGEDGYEENAALSVDAEQIGSAEMCDDDEEDSMIIDQQ